MKQWSLTEFMALRDLALLAEVKGGWEYLAGLHDWKAKIEEEIERVTGGRSGQSEGPVGGHEEQQDRPDVGLLGATGGDSTEAGER